jgi:hypothetical protein
MEDKTLEENSVLSLNQLKEGVGNAIWLNVEGKLYFGLNGWAKYFVGTGNYKNYEEVFRFVTIDGTIYLRISDYGENGKWEAYNYKPRFDRMGSRIG